MKQFKRNILDSMRTPIGGWSGFKHPQTGFEFRGDYKSIDDIIYHVKKYEEQNGLRPIANLRVFIEHYFCMRPEMAPYCENRQTITRTSQQVASGVSAYIKAKTRRFKGEEFAATRERAGERAAKCAKCSYNIPAGVKLGDKTVEDLYKEEKFRTEHDDRLLRCLGCGGCPLKPKVWFPPDIIIESLKGQTFRNLNKLIVTNEENSSERTQMVCWMIEEKFKKRVLDLAVKGLTVAMISDMMEGLSMTIINKWISDAE